MDGTQTSIASLPAEAGATLQHKVITDQGPAERLEPRKFAGETVLFTGVRARSARPY